MTTDAGPPPPEPEGTWGLVVPFVVCTSNGGPYDDDAFVAGYQAAYLDGLLRDASSTVIERYAYTALVPQLDLIAMRRGWTMSNDGPYHDDTWTLVTFRRAPR